MTRWIVADGTRKQVLETPCVAEVGGGSAVKQHRRKALRVIGRCTGALSAAGWEVTVEITKRDRGATGAWLCGKEALFLLLAVMHFVRVVLFFSFLEIFSYAA